MAETFERKQPSPMVDEHGAPAVFQVARVVSADATRIVVDGRCLRGPVRVGGEFAGATPGDNAEPVVWHGVKLCVERIEAYRRELEELPTALTARLSLRGDGVSVLREGWQLGGLPEAPSLGPQNQGG